MSENLPMEVEMENAGTGTVTFASDVIAIIAGLAATEIDGVAGMSSSNLTTSLGEILGRKNLTKGVKVEVGNEEAAVDLYMVLDYGARIPGTAAAVQENVKKAIETMTGLRVIEVNIHVQGVSFEKERTTAILPQESEEELPAPRVK